MKALSTFRILTIAVIIALLLSLSATNRVIADDVPPPPTQPEEITLPTEGTPPASTEEVVQTTEGVSSVDGSLEGEISPIQDGVDPLAEGGDAALPVVLEQMPEGTTIILETRDGIEPLATVAALDLLMVGDPIWCPEGAVPIPSTGGCSISYTSLSSLVYNIPEPGSNGVIWITAGVDLSPSSFISIDGSVFTNWQNYNLTINGGWDGGSLGVMNSSSTISKPIEIVNWTGNVTVNNISVNNTTSAGLSIGTAGDVTLNNLSFNNNNLTGLSVDSGGAIIAQDITATNNGAGGVSGSGAEFVADSLILSGSNEFSDNLGIGITANIGGNITITNLVANSNGAGSGYAAGAELVSTSGSVDLSGINQFNDNNNTGLYIFAGNIIQADNITANNNGMGNASGYGTELVASSLELSGINEFNSNFQSGISVTVTGDMSLSNVVANQNGSSGYGVGAELIAASGNVVMTGSNEFQQNNSSGLAIDSTGIVTLHNILANNNGAGGVYGYGAEILAHELNILGINDFSNNYESGLYANTSGNITITNMTANQNGQVGAYGVGTELISSGLVQISGINVFSENSSGGLSIDALAGVSIANTSINANLDTGLSVTTIGSIVVDCSEIIGNAGFGIDASTPVLTLNGTEVTQNFFEDVTASDSVFYNSNSCYTYSFPGPPDNGGVVVPPVILQSQNANSLVVVSGETVSLDCGLYNGTFLSLPSGDGAYLPCGFGEDARLILLGSEMMPETLPRGYLYSSGINLSITSENQLPQPANGSAPVWYWYVGENDEGQQITQLYYWDGSDWINVKSTEVPFATIYFVVPDSLKGKELAIMFWNGSDWVELTDGLSLGDGRFIRNGGEFDGKYFKAEVNFTGTFVLVQK